MNGLNFDEASPEHFYLNLLQESYCIAVEREGRVRTQIDRREIIEADIDHMIQTAEYDSISSPGRHNFRIMGDNLQEALHIAAFHYVSTRQEGLRWELLSVSPAMPADFDPDQYGFIQRAEDQL